MKQAQPFGRFDASVSDDADDRSVSEGIETVSNLKAAKYSQLSNADPTTASNGLMPRILTPADAAGEQRWITRSTC